MQYHCFSTKKSAELFLSEVKSQGRQGYIVEWNAARFEVRTWK